MDLFRHYTVCNSMQPDVYKDLLKSFKALHESVNADMEDTINYDDAYEVGEAQNSVALTMKNYEKKAGFSFRPFDK